MTRINVVGYLVVGLVLIAGMVSTANASCGQAARPITVTCGDGCGSQVGGVCTTGGTSGDFCFNGFGDCCGTSFTTANTAPDSTCAGGGINPPRCKLEEPFKLHRHALMASSCTGGLSATTIVIPVRLSAL